MSLVTREIAGLKIGIRTDNDKIIEISINEESIVDETVSPLHLEGFRQLEEYFAKKRKVFDLPLEMRGSAFQKKVWLALQQIPYGSVCSYQDIASTVGSEKAVRAVGSGNGKNPLPIVVPCHRVIQKNGQLGGYSGGIDIKIRLLKLERDQV